MFYNGEAGTEFKLSSRHVERIHPGAFDGLDLSDVRSMFNHDPSLILGRTKSGTMRLGVDNVGLWYETDLDLDNPVHRQVKSSVERGDVDGSSFVFGLKPGEGESVRSDGDVYVHNIEQIAAVYEAGPVTQPAYTASQASVSARMIARFDVRDIVREDEIREIAGQLLDNRL